MEVTAGRGPIRAIALQMKAGVAHVPVADAQVEAARQPPRSVPPAPKGEDDDKQNVR